MTYGLNPGCLALAMALSAAIVGVTPLAAATSKPNVLIILADDVGYGDLQSYNPERGKIPTPNQGRCERCHVHRVRPA